MADREKLALVVDSDEASREQVAGTLRQMGCAVEQAVTVREAVSQIGRQRPDVIVCNPVAPDREGFDLVTWLLTWLKADPKTQSIPILYLLTPDTPPELSSTLHAGPSDYLAGPFDADALRKRVRQKLGEDTPPEPVSRQENDTTSKSRPSRNKENAGSAQHGTWLFILVTTLLALVVPYFLYVRAPSAGIHLATAMYAIVAIAMLLNALFTSFQGFLSGRGKPAPPPSGRTGSGTAVVLASLPDDSAALLKTIDALAGQTFPLEIVLVCESRGEPLGEDLRSRVDGDWRVHIVRVPRGTPSNDALAAGLRESRGEVVGIFVAGQLPAPDSFSQAWRWIAAGYGLVRGRVTASNRNVSLVSRLTAIDLIADRFAASLDGGIPGTTNAYWHRGVLAALPAISGRTAKPRPVVAAYDGTIVAEQPAATTLRLRWRERLTWARSWSWLTPRQIWRVTHAASSSRAEHYESFENAVWRRPYVWVVVQVFPLAAYWIEHDGGNSPAWHVPIGILLGLYLLSGGPARAIAAFGLASPDERRGKFSFLLYTVVSAVLLSPLDNLADRVAQFMEVFGRSTSLRHSFPRETARAGSQVAPPPPARPPLPQQPESPIVPEVLPPTAPDTATILAEVSATLDRLQAADQPEEPVQPEGATAMEDQYTAPNGYSGPDHFPTVDDPWTRDLTPATEPPRDNPFVAPPAEPVHTNGTASSAGNAAASALERSQELLGLVQTLVQQVEALEAEKEHLRTQNDTMQEELDHQNAFRKTLLAGPGTAVADDEMRSLQGLVDSLAQEPYHIGVLAQIGGHAPALAAVVSGYVQMRTMLTEASSPPEESIPAEESEAPEGAEAAVAAEQPAGDFSS